MTLQERADSYAKAFAKYPASHLRVVQENGGECLYGTWMIGNDYRNKTRYYGAYPAGYLERVAALFPDAGRSVLHAFSGSMPKGPYDRCDVVCDADFQMDIHELCKDVWRWHLVVADPPYSEADAEKYATPMVDRVKVMRSLARVVYQGGHVVWLDTTWPMFSKTQWRTVGRICLIRSTNHRVRLISIFERVNGV